MLFWAQSNWQTLGKTCHDGLLMRKPEARKRSGGSRNMQGLDGICCRLEMGE